jgi:uncharacterized protein YndB with AHSA1/START domain
MKNDAKTAEDTSAREIAVSRLFAAPRELVYRMWTEPEHIVHWWGPTGFTDTINIMDVRPGGRWSHVMHGPDGVDYKNESVYVEVTPPERLVFDHVLAPNFRMTVTFEDQGGKTLVRVQLLFPDAALRDLVVKQFGALEGAKQNLEKLEAYLATQV